MRLTVLLAIILAFPFVALSQSFLWTKRAGLWAFDLGHAIGSDNAGNVYVAGKYEMNANFGGTTVSCAGNHDIYVAKYGPAGNFLWVRTAGGTSGDYAHALAVDGSGNVYVTGEFEGSAKFATGVTLQSNGDNDIFVAKYNTSGTLQWAKKLGGGNKSDKGLGISLHGTSVYITGKFEGTGNFAGTSLTSSGGKEMFLAKYATTGVFQWIKKAGGSGSDEGYAVANDAAGNVFVTGWFTGTANFSGQTVTSKGAKDVFVAKYSPSGSIVWVKKFGGSYDDFGRGIKVDNSNRIFITGGFRYKCAFGSTTLTATGKSDAFVASLNSTGSAVWAKKGGGSLDDEAMALAIDNSSNVFVTGRYGKNASFSGISLTGADSNEVFFAGYTAAGNIKWALKAGGSAEPSHPGRDPETGLSIAVDPSGNILASGTYRSNSTFGSTSLSAWSNTDIFITKIGQGSGVQGRIASPQIEPADSASYCVGGYAELKARCDSLSEFRWMKDGQIIGGQNSCAFRATSPGNYQLLVIQGNDTLQSAQTKVTETKKITSEITVPSEGFCGDSGGVLSASRGAGYLYQWKRNGWNIRGATSPTYAPTRDGKYQVKIIQGSCLDWSPAAEVKLQDCAADTSANQMTDLHENAEDSVFVARIYPNPNNGLFYLELNMSNTGDQRGEMRLQVINSYGHIYYEKVIANPASVVNEEISLDSSARTGVYFLQIFYGDRVETCKILLLR